MHSAAENPPTGADLADIARARWRVDPDALALMMARRRLNGPELARRAHLSASLIRALRNGRYPATTGATLLIICDALSCVPESIAAPIDPPEPRHTRRGARPRTLPPLREPRGYR